MKQKTTHNQRRKYERAMEFGNLSLEFGDAITALTYFRLAKTINRNAAEVYFGIARCLHDLKQFQKSIRYLYITLSKMDDADDEDSKDDVAWVCFFLGQNLLSMREYEEAEENFNQALTIAPDFGDAYIGRAFTYCALGKATQAFMSAEIAIKLKPDVAAAHHAFGLACKELKDYGKAINALKIATEIDSGYSPCYFLMGEIYSEQKRWGLAEEAYTEWLALHPELPEAKEKMIAAIYQLRELQ